MISEEVRVKKLRGEASRAILEDTLRFFFFFSGAASILSGCLLSSPAGFPPNRLLVLHPLLSPRNVHLSPPSLPACSPSLPPPHPTPQAFVSWSVQVKLEDIISHQSAESAAPLLAPPSFPQYSPSFHPLNHAHSPPWPQELEGGGGG